MKLYSTIALGLWFSASALPLIAQTNIFPTAGNVGIGTTSPAHKLQVVGNVYLGNGQYRTLIATYGNGAGTFIDSYDESNSVYKNLGLHGGTFTVLTGSATVSERLRIDNAGNVGVGTTAPTAKLEVAGSAFFTSRTVPTSGAGLEAFYSGGTSALLSYDRANSAYRSLVFDGSDFQFAVSGSEKMRVAANGNVGIGTTSPNGKLQIDLAAPGYGAIFNIVPNSNALLAFQVGGVDKGYLMWNYNDAGTGAATSIHLQNQQGKVHLFDNTGTGISVSSGNVGVGTTSPSHKLAVNGTIRAKEIIVDTGWSDYVFADDYRLAPLSEVESHIKAERHLPGIPSAAEVAEHGVSMGEMQSKLLAKIEELTLHQIAQEKRLKKLENENDALRAGRRDSFNRASF